ncbi:MAG: ketoacyl-ACP synthase III [Tepidanaerobacteraceae bacterium]|jgi:3-oxoacyl-[acyl-carrier-protein] synthase-3|nr:ketoacyl-ACP synthase III [Tepidanaerobacteraceae bacterium]
MGERYSLKKAGIIGIGSYVPDRVVTNLDLEKMVDTTDEWIKTRTGISLRRIGPENACTSDMGAEAARKALEHARLSPENIDLIIVASASPDMIFPSTACIIQSKIGASNAAAFDIQAGCTGFVYALTCAVQFIVSGMYKNILVVGAEMLSRITDWEDRNTCVLFGDGAGAVVISEVEEGGILSSYLGADGTGADLLILPAGGSKEPASIDTVAKRRHFIQMNGNEVFKFAVRILEEAARKATEKANLSMNDVDYIVPHQANIRIIDAAVKRLKFPREQLVMNLDRYGNMSSASIPVALDEAYRDKRIKRGDIVLLVGFGAGLTWGANLLEWSID